MDVSSVLDSLKIETVRERGGEIMCRCPLTSHENDARRPAFQINAESGLWICFKGCGKGTLQQLAETILGDAKKARQLVRESGGLSSGTRVGKSGLANAIAAIKRIPTPERPSVRLATYAYTHDDQRGRVPPWVRQRGFTSETLNHYRLGYSAAYNALVIPVPDAHALIYRALPGTDSPKYKYTRDFKAHSVLYTLFGFEKHDDTIILVEGPLDALWLRQQGFKNSLSILGGGTVGIKQREIIAQLDPSRIVLAFDNDEGGERTTEKALLWLKRYDCYTVDWKRFGTKFVQDEDDNPIVVDVKDVAELDLPELLLMFGEGGPLLVQPASIPKIGLKVRPPLDIIVDDAVELEDADMVKQSITSDFQSEITGASPVIRSKTATAEPDLPFDKSSLAIRAIPHKEALPFLQATHYSHAAPTGLHVGLFNDETLVGVATIKSLSGGNGKSRSRYQVFSEETGLAFKELSRLALSEERPKNSESWFIGRLLKFLRQERVCDILLSYADPTYGHMGTIYQASNFLYYGISTGHADKRGSFRFPDGHVVGQSSLRRITTETSAIAREQALRDLYPDQEIVRIAKAQKHVYLYPVTRRARQPLLDFVAARKESSKKYPKPLDTVSDDVIE